MTDEPKWELVFYKTENDKTPVVEFIKGLPNKLQAKALKDLELLETHGNDLTMPLLKSNGKRHL